MNYPKAADCNTSLDSEERMVVNAIKGHYDGLVGSCEGYELAKRIIGEIIYGNLPNSTPKFIYINYLRNLILKVYKGDAKQWESRTQQWLMESLEKERIWKDDFYESFLGKHFAFILHFEVNRNLADKPQFWYNILDLNVDEGEEKKVFERLTKSQNEVN